MLNNKRRRTIVTAVRHTKILIPCLVLILLVVSSVEATTYSLGTFKKGSCITLKQTCANCSYVNVTSVTYPNSSIYQINSQMSGVNKVYYYDFCSTSLLGQYHYDTIGDPDGLSAIGSVSFTVTETGEQFDMSQSIIIVALLGIMGLFLGLGFTFAKEKWKLRSLFFVSALIVGLIILNSVRVIMGSSNSLSVMGNSGLIIGIVLVVFMMLYLFIYATIEVFGYFKKRKEMKWEAKGL